MEADFSSSSISNNDQEELLKLAKVKMDEVREENQRLKKLLAQIVKEYHSLEKRISLINQSKGSPKIENSTENHQSDDEEKQDKDLVSLSLGSWSSEKKHDNNNKQVSNNNNNNNKKRKVEEGLELGLDCRFEQYSCRDVATNSTMDTVNDVKKEEENIATWPPASRDVKAKESVNNNGREQRDEESLHQPQVKKTRVCIRSRCDSPTVHDGCQWRKYGQKIAKGNPCPRAYYRCTVSSNCPVRKQVQRCPQDMSILITTYEGTHNHPLPLSATAMASATSAAAAMLKTGSLTSQKSTLPTTSSYGLHASNLITTFNNNPSMITAASHNSHPTVTLDLTTANPDFSPFNWPFPSNSSNSNSSRNSSSFLNFSSSPSSFPSLDFSSNAPSNPSRANNGYMNNYDTLFPNNTNNDISKSIYQSLNSHHQALNVTIAAAATKAIASNPNFQSVLEAAISSYVGNSRTSNNSNNNTDHKKSSLLFPWSSSTSQSSKSGSLSLCPNPSSSSLKSNANGTVDTRDNST
ncbi:WRKY transcription factor 72A-like [Silene latifolia]|uniref:WRKY transcription factor 72A-like n=1 Tax=Silene latifolia TaxID=37657 RepID=UPI003D783219